MAFRSVRKSMTMLNISEYKWGQVFNMKASKFLSLYLILYCFTASAEFKYAVIDYEALIQQSNAFHDIEKKIEAKRKEFFAAAQQKEKTLIKQGKELKRKCATLSETECESLTKTNNIELNKLNEEYKIQRAALNDAFADTIKNIDSTLNLVVKDLVKENGYNIIFHKRTLLYNEDGIDITPKALKILNHRLPASGVKF